MRKLTSVVVFALTICALVVSAQTVDTVRYRAVMSSSHEAPTQLIGVEASALGLVEFIIQRDAMGVIQSAVVDFRVDYYFGQPETLTNMHIHTGAEGVPGGVVIGSIFGSRFDVPVGTGTMFRQGQVTTATQIATLEAIMANPGAYYLNVHSASNPGGIMRGQLMPEDPSEPWLKALAAKVDAVAANTDKIDGLASQLTQIQNMIRVVGSVLGLRL